MEADRRVGLCVRILLMEWVGETVERSVAVDEAVKDFLWLKGSRFHGDGGHREECCPTHLSKEPWRSIPSMEARVVHVCAHRGPRKVSRARVFMIKDITIKRTTPNSAAAT